MTSKPLEVPVEKHLAQLNSPGKASRQTHIQVCEPSRPPTHHERQGHYLHWSDSTTATQGKPHPYLRAGARTAQRLSLWVGTTQRLGAKIHVDICTNGRLDRLLETPQSRGISSNSLENQYHHQENAETSDGARTSDQRP